MSHDRFPYALFLDSFLILNHLLIPYTIMFDQLITKLSARTDLDTGSMEWVSNSFESF